MEIIDIEREDTNICKMGKPLDFERQSLPMFQKMLHHVTDAIRCVAKIEPRDLIYNYPVYFQKGKDKVGVFHYDICIPESHTLIDLRITQTSHTSPVDAYCSNFYNKRKVDVARLMGFNCIFIWQWDPIYKVIRKGMFEPTSDIPRLPEEEPKDQIYCDLSKESGAEYLQQGYKIVEELPPKVIWSLPDNGNILIESRKQEKKIMDNPQELADTLKRGWLPVYDCGALLLRLDKKVKT